MSGYNNRKREFKPTLLFINGIKVHDTADNETTKKRQLARNRLEDIQMYKEAGLNPKDFVDELNTTCRSRVSKAEEIKYLRSLNIA